MEKPKNIEEYTKWLHTAHRCDISNRTQTYYESVAHKISKDFRKSLFWKEVCSTILEQHQKFFLTTKYYLFLDPAEPQIAIKPFDSFFLNTFRKNVLENTHWPNPPIDGWFLPTNWFLRINDIVRTYFVIKYLDGVDFFTQHLSRVAESNKLSFKIDYEAKEEGYYAVHFLLTFPCDVPKEDWDTVSGDFSVEIQVTTQLQEVIRNMLHKYYEVVRSRHGNALMKWQWDYKSDEFSANYLGHILHYVEGMIMDIRSKQDKEAGNED